MRTRSIVLTVLVIVIIGAALCVGSIMIGLNQSFRSTDREAYRQSVLKEHPDAIFTTDGTPLAYGVKSFRDGDMTLCDRLQKPYIPRAPETPLEEIIRQCKDVFSELNQLATAQRTGSSVTCKQAVTPTHRLTSNAGLTDATDLCTLATKANSLESIIAMYENIYVNGFLQ